MGSTEITECLESKTSSCDFRQVSGCHSKEQKVPSLSIKAGLVTRASVSFGLSQSGPRVWLHHKLFSIGQLLLISSANNDAAETHKALLVISNIKTRQMWFDCSLCYPLQGRVNLSGTIAQQTTTCLSSWKVLQRSSGSQAPETVRTRGPD